MKVSFIEALIPSIEVKLFTSKKKYKKALEKNGEVYSDLNSDAQCTPVELKDGSIVYFVVIIDQKQYKYEECLALLAHEAVHISQFYFKSIGEYEPAIEEQAYVIQSICQCLFIEYIKFINKKIKNKEE